MANVTQGLFGFDPSQSQQLQATNQAQREDALNRRATEYAQLSPMQAARASMYKSGSQLMSAFGGMMGNGAQDPELEAQSLMKQTAATLDLNDHVAVRKVANKWLQSGNPTLQNKALQLNEVANNSEENFNKRTKEKATNDLAARKASQQAAFNNEYAQAADAEGRLAVTRKYAEMPELIKLDEASLARKEKAAEAAVAREEKTQASKEAQSALFEQQRFLAGESARGRSAAAAEGRANRASAKSIADNYKVTAAQEKINNAIEKQDDLDAKASRNASASAVHSDQMIKDAAAAKTLVKFETTGRTGQAAAAVNPGGEAGILRNRIATLKANLGFDRLQKMRDESPTGGALGQVAVQELEALQASVASLSPLQSPEELSSNFDKIGLHYKGWKETVTADDKARVARRAGPQGITMPGATARNPKAAPTTAGWGKATESK